MSEGHVSDPDSADELRRRINGGAASANDFRGLADILVAAGQDEEAVAVYQRGLALALSQTEEAELSMELGWLFLNLGRLDGATELAHRALRAVEHQSSTPRIAYLRGASHAVLAHCLSDVDPAGGRAAAEVALKVLGPALSDAAGLTRHEKAWVWIDAARLCWLLGAADDCLAHCEQALVLELADEERLTCLAVYAEALRAKERFAEAREHLTEAFRYTKSCGGAVANLHLALGLTERAANDLTTARQAFQEALSIGRLDPAMSVDARFLRDTYGNLGFVSYELGMYQEAAKALSEAREHCRSSDDPASAGIVLVLGFSLSALGRVAEARRLYEEALASPATSEKDKESARSALASLPGPTGWLRAIIDRARIYTRLIHAHLHFYGFPMLPEDYHARLGAAYFELGNFRRSAQNFEKSEVFRHPSAHGLARYNAYYLGFGYMNLGDHQKARQWLERYLAYSPRDTYVRGVRGGLRPSR